MTGFLRVLALTLVLTQGPAHAAATAATLATPTPLPSVRAPRPDASADVLQRLVPIAYTERRLANGLHLIAAPTRRSPTVSVQVWYHVGARDDPPGRSGFAHLFEHLMFKSTRYLANEQFDRLTEDVGGANNAYTSPDVTVFDSVVPANHLETLLWAEAERMSTLQVDEASFRSERAVVQEELRERVLTAPYGRFYNAMPGAAYLRHPYRRPAIGLLADLDAASLADVRDFHQRHYRPDNATLVVAGDFEPAQLDRWVDRHFGRIPKADDVPAQADAAEPPWPRERSVQVRGPRVPLPAVALMWLAPPATDADAPALRVAAAALGHGESSRLNQSLVYRQQLATQTGFDADLRMGPGLLTAQAIAAAGVPLSALQAALLADVRRLARAPLPDAELDKLKMQLLTQALVQRQTPAGMAAALGEAAVLQGDAARAHADLVALAQVSPADVQRAAARHFSTHHVTLSYRQASAASPASGSRP